MTRLNTQYTLGSLVIYNKQLYAVIGINVNKNGEFYDLENKVAELNYNRVSYKDLHSPRDPNMLNVLQDALQSRRDCDITRINSKLDMITTIEKDIAEIKENQVETTAFYSRAIRSAKKYAINDVTPTPEPPKPSNEGISSLFD